MAGTHLLAWFWELDGTRQATGAGLQALRPTEIEAWARLTGTEVRAWEAMILFQMDRARLRASHQKDQKGTPASGRPHVEKTEITRNAPTDVLLDYLKGRAGKGVQIIRVGKRNGGSGATGP